MTASTQLPADRTLHIIMACIVNTHLEKRLLLLLTCILNHHRDMGSWTQLILLQAAPIILNLWTLPQLTADMLFVCRLES